MGESLSEEEIDALLGGVDDITIVLTTYGHGDKIDKMAVSVFDRVDDMHRNRMTNPRRYCDTINALALKDNKWIYAQVLKQNIQYPLSIMLR
jgi:hypothetical protein